MARFSNPSQTRFFVFEDQFDNYNHTEVAANWDAIDALFGWPSSGTWPSVGNSVYSYLTNLQLLVEPVGTLRMFVPATSAVPIPGGTGGVPDAAGWCVCDGSIVAANNHSFKDSLGNAINSSIALPDFRNKMTLGADATRTFGVAGTNGNGSAFAPGPQGLQGSNATVGINVNLPNHYHLHDHLHEVGNVTGSDVETSDAVHGIGTAANGTGQPITTPNHNHRVDLYSSLARNPSTPNYRVVDAPNAGSTSGRPMTTLQNLSSGGSPTEPTGGSPGDVIAATSNADARPASIGVVYLYKVKNVLRT